MKKQSAAQSAFFNPRALIGFALCLIGLLLALAGWSKSVTGMSAGATQTNPVPLINQPLVPDAIAPGGPDFTLTLNGTGFVSGSVVNWNGSARATTFVNGSQLTASILASDIATAGTASVTVVNPGPGGGTSNVVFFSGTLPTSSVSLSRADVVTGLGPYSIIAADFNGDGNLDLSTGNTLANTFSILLGNGDGTFQPHAENASSHPTGLGDARDFNGDGKLDLAMLNGFIANTVSILLGNGDGTFQPPVDYATGSVPLWLTTGDFNGDGNLDLAVADFGNFDGRKVSILLGNGDGTFQPHVEYATGSLPRSVTTGDFNGDGKLDLALANQADNTVSILLGNGDGTFRSHTDYATGSTAQVVTTGDFNEDGKLDLAVTADGSNTVSILLGNGDGTFPTHVEYATGGGGAFYMTMGDLNGDGKLDLAVANAGTKNPAVSILLGNGDGTFPTHVEYAVGSGPAEVTTADFNGDGRLDLVIANNIDNTVSVLLQTTNVSVFATGLEYPRGLKFGPGGYLFVAEAGSGGTMSTDGICDQVIPPVGPYLGGFTSRISKVAKNGTVSTVADNLPSGINAFGDVLGIADVAFLGGHIYALSSGGGCSHGFANDDAAVLQVLSDGTTRSIADLSVFQKAHPVKNPNPLDFEPDGSWYSMIAVGDHFLAVEPNHGELDMIHTDGSIERITDISAGLGHIVPTAVASDGVNFYVGNLGTFPIVDGSQVILQIRPSGKAKIFATGFTTILGLAFDSHGTLFVLEDTTGGNEFPTPGTGKILRLDSDGKQTEVATGLNLPTGMTFDSDGNIYVSSWGFGPPGMGEIDKVTVSK